MATHEASRSSIQEPAEHEASFGNLPILREERIWGFGGFTSVNVALAIATWAFLGGGATALFVGGREGVAAILIGNVIGVIPVALATCIPSAKYGLEQYTALRSVFGTNGIRVIVFGFFAVVEVGWATVLAVMFGRATTNVANEAFGLSAGANGLLVSVLALTAIAVSWLILARGPVSIKWFNNIVAPGLAVVTIVMLVLILMNRSLDEILATPALSPTGNGRLDFMIAVEFNIAYGFSWWLVMGSLARLTTTQRASFWPTIIGLFGATSVASIVGLFAALSYGDSDPTVWMIPLGGTVFGMLALLFVAFANVTSIVSVIYSTCLAFRQAGGQALKRMRWELLTAAFFVGPAVLVFFPSTIYDNFLTFVVWSSAALAPLTGIGLADFFLLRRQHLSLRAIYDKSPRSPYAFWRETNPVAFVALAIGVAVYIWLLNPQTLNQADIFVFVSASVPALLAAGLVHVLLTKLLVQPLGKGGYSGAAEYTRNPRI